MTMKERLIKYITSKNISLSEFERRSGLGNGAAAKMGDSTRRSTFDKISKAFPDLNITWLRVGEGRMLKPEYSGGDVISGNYNINAVNSHVSQVNGALGVSNQKPTLHPMVLETEFAPVIPQNWAKRPDFDTYEAVLENIDKMEMSPVAVADLPINVWHRMTSNCMYPYCFAGDKIALTEIPDKNSIIPGDIYGVDTISNGLVVRILYPIENGYRAHAYNNAEYPDFIIPHTDIIRIFRKVGLFRI